MHLLEEVADDACTVIVHQGPHLRGDNRGEGPRDKNSGPYQATTWKSVINEEGYSQTKDRLQGYGDGSEDERRAN